MSFTGTVTLFGTAKADPHSSEYLAEQAAKGDEGCFVELCRLLENKLFRTAKGILGSEASALDAVSEAVFRAYKGIKKLRNPKFVETWFIRIVLNAANDIRRKQKREITMEAVPEGLHYDNHDELEFYRMIEMLQIELREVISLKYYSGYTLAETAAILKIPEGTAKSRLHRALELLRLEAADEY